MGFSVSSEFILLYVVLWYYKVALRLPTTALVFSFSRALQCATWIQSNTETIRDQGGTQAEVSQPSTPCKCKMLG